MSARLVRFAICQLASEPASTAGNIEANVIKVERYLDQAREQRADVFVLPEFFLTGDISNNLNLADDGTWLKRFKELAQHHKMDIVAGTIVEKSHRHDEQTDLYNIAYYIRKDGEVLCRYKKKNLWVAPLTGVAHNDSEREYLTAGDQDRHVFDTEKFRCGLLVCWDLAFPEACRTLMGHGAEVVIVPTCWTHNDLGPIGKLHDPTGEGETAFLDSLVIARAYENECCVVFVNCGGSREEGFLGRSAVAMPFKGAQRLESPEEQMKVFEVDLRLLEDAEEVYKVHEDFRKRQQERLQRPRDEKSE